MHVFNPECASELLELNNTRGKYGFCLKIVKVGKLHAEAVHIYFSM